MEQVISDRILKTESENSDMIYLYLEGGTWCAYEHSAYYLVSLKAPVILEKVSCQKGSMILKALFAMDDMCELLSPRVSLKQVADNSLILKVEDDINGFQEWKQSQIQIKSA